jgi:hypothetical protein
VKGGTMTLETVRAVFAWCSVINMVLLLLWFLFFALAHDWIHKIHSKWFNLSVEKFDSLHYTGMVIFKICILLFNLVPYLAMRIVG